MQTQPIFHVLLENAVYLMVLCVAIWLTGKWINREALASRLLIGAMFGATAITVMVTPFRVADGIFFDGRSVVLAVAAFSGGPLVGAVAAVMAGVYRIWLGGSGAAVGLAVIVTSFMLGLVFRRLAERRGRPPEFLFFMVMGLAVHLAALGWFLLLPVDFIAVILAEVAPAYLLVLTLTTACLGLALQELDHLDHFKTILRSSEKRHKQLFDSAAVAIWDEDFSDVLRLLDTLRDEGVGDLRGHLARRPEVLARLAGALKVNRVNDAALVMFGAGSERELIGNLQRTFGPQAREILIEELCALWERKPAFRSRVDYLTLAGRPLAAIISMPLPQSPLAARSVPVSMLDISDLEATQHELLEERRRLTEIIWGTRAGTWEWHVPTGAAVFNERWAEIAGYTLAELSPVSIATWQALVHPDDLAGSDARLEKLFAREIESYEYPSRMRHKDGSWVWVMDRGNVVAWAEDGSPLRVSGTHIDITAQKVAEETLARLSRVRETLLECHAAILRERDEARLLESLCEILAANRGYVLAWIGRTDPERPDRIKPWAAAGTAIGYLDGIDIRSSEDHANGLGPAGSAFRTGQPQVTHAVAEDPRFGPWAERAVRFGIASSATLPIRGDHGVTAVLNVYSTANAAFDNVELILLRQFANSLGIALTRLHAMTALESVSRALSQSSLAVIEAMSAALEQRDPYTAGHQTRVAVLAVAIARELGWAEERIEGLRLGAMIHDIGKIGVPADILNRPGKLAKAEMEIIKTHPQVGHDILKNVTFPWPIQDMVLQHHERLDGSGYPRGLKGAQIIEEAKVLCVADVVEAISSHRPYRAALGIGAGMEEIERGKGTLYEPAITDACLSVLRRGDFDWSRAT
jgi:PAS domain S-box-containing protein/putative nucleotidyltransferase with HDIG domain